MRRRVTLWYSQADSERAADFRARWAEYLYAELEHGSHGQKIDTALEIEAGSMVASDRARVVVLLVGDVTLEDAPLLQGVAASLTLGTVVVAICLAPNAKVPELLLATGCEVLNWDSPEIPQACERAALSIHRAPAIIEAARSAVDDEECTRAPTAIVAIVEGDRVPIPE
jgi:hypothetical protein